MDVVGNRVHTFVRVKPTADAAQDMIKFGPDTKTIDIHIPQDARKGLVNNSQTDWSFRLDGVLHNTSQDQLYEKVARNLVSQALIGYSGTIMCYGQTGAGKTYTMKGATSEYERRGIIPRAIEQVFKAAAHSADPLITVQISYLEIYNETLCDLLASTTTHGTTDDTQMAVADCPQGVYVKGLSIHPVGHEEDALNLFFEGETNRVTAEHTLNRHSSRSHCIFTMYIESCFRIFSDVKCVKSKLTLIDLAGSERLSKTGSEGQVLREAMYINRSLSFLEQFIIALTDPKQDHIPFRQSKLTHVLKDSLGGNCNTILVVNICAEAVHLEETLASLRFATRMKWVTTEPIIRETCHPVGTVKALEKEIALLKQELAIQNSLVNCSVVTHNPLTDAQVAEIRSQVHRYLKGAIDEIDVVNVRQVQEVFKQFKLILRQQEHEVETRLRSKYLLIDKNNFVALAAVQKAGVLNFSGHLVPEEDGQDSTPSAAKRGRKKKSMKGNELPRKEGIRTSPSGKDLGGFVPSKSQVIIPTKNLDGKEATRNQEAVNIDAEHSKPAPVEDSQQPSSPPPKPAAFEQFKEEHGSDINRIFKENKSVLLAKKKRSSAVAQRINFIKHEMEDIKKALEAEKQEWWQQGGNVDEEGQSVMDEEPSLITKLKDLKEQYRAGYAELQDLKAEVQYYQQLVDQCRHKLISEFELWYNESFLIPKDVQEALKPGGSIRPGMIPINRVMCLEEDEQERFERMQEATLPKYPASVSFYKAQMKTEQKHAYSRAMSSLEQMRRKPGLIPAAGKKNTPAFLDII